MASITASAAAAATTKAHHEILSGVPEGFDAIVLSALVTPPPGSPPGTALPIAIHIARDDRRMETLAAALAFFAPHVKVQALPAWDTVPYDRIGPNAEIVARRIATLSRLSMAPRKEPTVVLTTVNAILQRLPPRSFLRKSLRQVAPGQRIDMARLVQSLSLAGYQRTGTVMEPGDYAQRGHILDVFPPGRVSPVRLDFFGDTLETMKSFDTATQRTSKVVQKLAIMPNSEVAAGETAVALFRQRYVEMFGATKTEDPLYHTVSAGGRYPGQEHWLPLFHENLETLFDYCPDALISFDHLAGDAVTERVEQITEHYKARTEALETTAFGAPAYKAVPPDQLYLTDAEWKATLATRDVRFFTPFEQAEPGAGGVVVRSSNGRTGRTFAAERGAEGQNVFDAVRSHIDRHVMEGRRVLLAAWTPGARERMMTLLGDHNVKNMKRVEAFGEAIALPKGDVAMAVLGLESGFEAPGLVLIAEQDIIGDRMVRPRRKARKAADIITEATSLATGDLVVHADHGIGRFEGLKTITALGAPHDCLQLAYADGSTLLLPVENIDLLSRFGTDDGSTQLDRLGGAAWQSRKARLKQRLKEMASELIKIAALRQLKEAPAFAPPSGAFDEFVARFPYEETEDQAASIDSVLADLNSGRPMDRLVCGDVGFGKTEVALRAAFVAAMAGVQVAVVVPTTLLARQHFKTFTTRFQDLPIRIGQASRLVPAKELAETKAALTSGQVDIVIGTHALLSKSMSFARLGLLIIDEEQHFGVAHKERLKQLKEDVHVLTLSATPIPRTLQLALTGVRELSLITTPPVDRLAVRTYISPFDPVIIREALRRERYRGGQSFYVVPRLTDLDEVTEFLREAVPELKIARAHGQLTPSELEDIMNAFYDGSYDVLVSTAIVESGLDVPNANTMIVHRADMFGLAQLYQLRGRVGRSKTRAYSYFTTPADKKLTPMAEKRLKVLQSLDTLGAGFSLASHDLDIRGSGNLLGEEQSGHIREVGFELYQSMLEDAIVALKGADLGDAEEQWSPQISVGTAVLIPESYVADLPLRLGLYRRLSTLSNRVDIDQFGEELADRFGPAPEEVRQLLDVVEIKSLCRQAGIQQIDAGPKGAVLTFRKGVFANQPGIANLIAKSRDVFKVQADQRLVFKANWEGAEARLRGVRDLVQILAQLAAAKAKAA